MPVTASSLICVASHCGMGGSAIVRRLQARGYTEIVNTSRVEFDLTEQTRVRQFVGDHRIARMVLATARMGGAQD